MRKKISNLQTQIVPLKGKLHALRHQAHFFFDQIWMNNYLERNEAYRWLADWLEIPEPDAHMRFMNEKTCAKVIEASICLLNDMRRLDLDFGAEIKHPHYELIKNDIRKLQKIVRVT